MSGNLDVVSNQLYHRSDEINGLFPSFDDMNTKLKYCPRCKRMANGNYCQECGTALTEIPTKVVTCPCCKGKGTINQPDLVCYNVIGQPTPQVMTNK